MALNLKNVLIVAAIFVVMFGLVIGVASQRRVEASTSFTTPTQPDHTYKNFTFLSATTTTATSTNTTDGGQYFVINGVKKVTFYFTHGGTATTSTGGARFNLQTSRDGVNWDNFSKLIGADQASTATSSYTIIGATSTIPVAMDLSDDTFYAVRCISNELSGSLGLDGEQTCQASGEF